jgi:hypothetical protein
VRDRASCCVRTSTARLGKSTGRPGIGWKREEVNAADPEQVGKRIREARLANTAIGPSAGGEKPMLKADRVLRTSRAGLLQ